MTEFNDLFPFLGHSMPLLTKREEVVLEKRQDKVSFAKIGREFGICRERIRQIEAKALRKLQKRKRNMKQLSDEQIDELIERGIGIFELVKKVKAAKQKDSDDDGGYTSLMADNGKEILIFKDAVVIQDPLTNEQQDKLKGLS